MGATEYVKDTCLAADLFMLRSLFEQLPLYLCQHSVVLLIGRGAIIGTNRFIRKTAVYCSFRLRFTVFLPEVTVTEGLLRVTLMPRLWYKNFRPNGNSVSSKDSFSLKSTFQNL